MDYETALFFDSALREVIARHRRTVYGREIGRQLSELLDAANEWPRDEQAFARAVESALEVLVELAFEHPSEMDRENLFDGLSRICQKTISRIEYVDRASSRVTGELNRPERAEPEDDEVLLRSFAREWIPPADNEFQSADPAPRRSGGRGRARNSNRARS
ncbi:hypothetical protein [Burkholderia sp. Ac-20365]|uniref:hypothetical protein n=1 Tax=Burkholderia sp. Ac-20365 TaxID=2703897 RepID=UPI00197C825F|nr:hypothetical protein [Burkholderia sp. Ac-20365]MBN3761003.1 hypothetical protein [Burkholderia sp. Ac-20365]